MCFISLVCQMNSDVISGSFSYLMLRFSPMLSTYLGIFSRNFSYSLDWYQHLASTSYLVLGSVTHSVQLLLFSTRVYCFSLPVNLSLVRDLLRNFPRKWSTDLQPSVAIYYGNTTLQLQLLEWLASGSIVHLENKQCKARNFTVWNF